MCILWNPRHASIDMFTCVNALKILVMGGTRFVGKAIVDHLLIDKHEITLFTRGNNPYPNGVRHIKGDRKTSDIDKLEGLKFDVIIDCSGRNLSETEDVIAKTGYPEHRFIYISSAGIYSYSESLPVEETSPIDPNSRHIGKAETESWLKNEGIPFTVFRPTYIYGPSNYNPIEKWFFDRITYSQIIPLPDQGMGLTQLGHVADLARAIKVSLDYKIAENKIYNCSSAKAITFKGLVYAAAKASGSNKDELRLCSFNTSKLDPKARKAFPLRLPHFFYRYISNSKRVRLETYI